jgi:hypothetical protein
LRGFIRFCGAVFVVCGMVIIAICLLVGVLAFIGGAAASGGQNGGVAIAGMGISLLIVVAGMMSGASVTLTGAPPTC